MSTVDRGPQPEPEVRARPAEPDELSKAAVSLIKEATSRGWDASATYARGSALVTVMVEDVGAPLTPTDRLARKAQTAWTLVDSVVVRMASPHGDRAVFAFENGAAVNAWVAPRGATGASPAGYLGARKFLFGPWEGGMAHVPAWRRAKIAERKRLAKLGLCIGCGAQVLYGVDQNFGEQPATADAVPIEGPLALLIEVVAALAGRKVFTAWPGMGGGGVELHRRDDWQIGDRRYPAHLEHRCDQETP